jgi:hypothetical protein
MDADLSISIMKDELQEIWKNQHQHYFLTGQQPQAHQQEGPELVQRQWN